MSSSKKSKRRSAKRSKGDGPGDGGGTRPEAPRSRAQRWGPLGLAIFGGVLAFLGFAGFDLWPIAFVAFVPLFAAIEWEPEARTRRVVLIAWLYGFVGIWGGYYWIVEMLEKFSGFSTLPNIFFASALMIYLAGQFALFGWLWHRATKAGANRTLTAVAAWCGIELLFPNLFPFFYGASFHPVPALIQIADLGGPTVVSALCLAVNAALYEVLRAAVKRERIPRAAPAAAAVALAFTLVYGFVRIGQVEERAAKAETMDVGLVQVNMGIFSKREDPYEGHRRHLSETKRLQHRHDLDLVVWPESAYTFFIPERVDNIKRMVMGPDVDTPIIFGGLARRNVDGERRHFNTAYLANAEGDVLGTYDKTYLLAFGEYLPFGETFPILYEWSPNSGRFTPGSHVRPLELNGHRITTLICYEDILPGFVREAVLEGDPHLLVNITNDAWFGDTHEPWIHLALAKFRSVEHRRALVRTTNSGVSAVVDPAGRVVEHTGVFTRETLHAEVPLMHGSTVYGTLGSWFGWLSVAGIAVLAFVLPWRRRKGG